jgi:hypothetical protein
MTIINALPFLLLNGTTADATQVDANFNEIVNDVNSNAAHNGVNTDITALPGLTTPLTPTQGGSSVYVGGISTGSANAQVVSGPIPLGFSLIRGNRVVFLAGFTNTGALTLNVNATGAIAVNKFSPSGTTPLSGGEIFGGTYVEVMYDGSAFVLYTNCLENGGFGPQTAVASASTVDLGLISSHFAVITGNVTITSFGSSAVGIYPFYTLFFTGSPLLTYNATSLILPGQANIQAAPGDSGVALYVGSGNWAIISYTRRSGTAIINPTPMAGAQGLVIVNDSGTPNTKIDVTADQAVMINPTGNVPIYATGISRVINCTTTGADGLDTGALANSTWYNIFLISNGSSTVGLASLSATAPTMPSGYIYLVRVGAMRTDGSANFLRTRQSGSRAQYTITAGSNTTAMPTMTSGSAGLWTAVAVASFVPPTATQIKGALFNTSPGNNTGGGVAPNNGYVAVGNAPVNFINSTGTTFGSLMQPFDFVLESANIYYTSTSGSASALYALGWTDKVNAN